MTPQAERFMQIVAGPDAQINVAEAALLIASEEYSDLDVPAYLALLDEMAGKLKILVRMLRNLKGIYSHHREWLKALTATDRIISVMPNSAAEYRDRGMIYLNLECFRAALFDLQAYLKMLPVAGDADTVHQKVVELQVVAARLN